MFGAIFSALAKVVEPVAQAAHVATTAVNDAIQIGDETGGRSVLSALGKIAHGITQSVASIGSDFGALGEHVSNAMGSVHASMFGEGGGVSLQADAAPAKLGRSASIYNGTSVEAPLGRFDVTHNDIVVPTVGMSNAMLAARNMDMGSLMAA
jgi:hypothetical protein